MDGTVVVIILVAVVVVGFIVLKRKGKLGMLKGITGWIFPEDPRKRIEKLRLEREREEARSVELKQLLQARQDLVKAQAENRKLEKKIAETTVEHEIGTPQFPRR